MSNASFMLLSLVLLNFGFLQNSFGRFILVEVDQKETTKNNSGSDVRGKETCLREEGIPDACLTYFKTGERNKRCTKWLETNHAMVEQSETRLRKCVNESTSDLIRTRSVSCCSKTCFNCKHCVWSGPFYLICMPICIEASCEGGHASDGEWRKYCKNEKTEDMCCEEFVSC